MEDKQLFLDVYSIMSRFAESLLIAGRSGDAVAVLDIRSKFLQATRSEPSTDEESLV